MDQLLLAQFEARGLYNGFGSSVRQGSPGSPFGPPAPASGCSVPEAGVGDVVEMKLGALSFPSGTVAGVDLGSQLLSSLREMVVHFEDWMLRDADSRAGVSHLAQSLWPYNDPSLNRRSGYLHVLKHLRQCGILGTW